MREWNPPSRRTLFVALTTVPAAGLMLFACQAANRPSEPSVVAAPAVADRANAQPAQPAAEPDGSVTESGKTTCAAPKTSFCHVPDGQSVQQVCVDSTGLAAHLQHPKDYALKTFYRDKDGDTYGDPSLIQTGCVSPAGYIGTAGDCNDNNAAIHPGATEACGDGIDNNCNGQIDEGCAITCPSQCMFHAVDFNGSGPLSCTSSGSLLMLQKITPSSSGSCPEGAFCEERIEARSSGGSFHCGALDGYPWPPTVNTGPGISQAEYVACLAAVRARATLHGQTCPANP